MVLPFYACATSVFIPEHNKVPQKLICPANSVLKVEAVKWEFVNGQSDYNQLSPIERAIYDELLENPKTFNNIARTCNNKHKCEIEKLNSGEKFKRKRK